MVAMHHASGIVWQYCDVVISASGRWLARGSLQMTGRRTAEGRAPLSPRTMLLVCLAAAVLLTACGSPQPRPTVTTEVMREQILAPANDLSFNDVYQRVTQAITRDGSVFHTTIRISRA